MKDEQTLYSTTQIELRPESVVSTASTIAKPLGNHIAASESPNSKEKVRTKLNWRRIWKYVALVLIGSFVVGFFFGAIRGIITAGRTPIPVWIEVAQSVTMTVVIGSIFALFSYRQYERTLLNVLVVALIGVSITLLTAPFVGMPMVQAIMASVYLLVLSMICVPIGLNIRVHKETARLKVPALGHKGHNSAKTTA